VLKVQEKQKVVKQQVSLVESQQARVNQRKRDEEVNNLFS